MQPFNTYLRGWLGLFDAKVRGQSPAAFEESVRPSLDVLNFLLAQKGEHIADSTAAIGGGAEGFNPSATAAATVPADEVWYVAAHSCQALANLGAGEELVIVPAYQQRMQLGIYETITLQPPTARTVAGMRPSGCALRPYIIGPGGVLGVWVELIVTAAAISVLFNYHVIKIKI